VEYALLEQLSSFIFEKSEKYLIVEIGFEKIIALKIHGWLI
jgi:hypothetical protein